MRQQCKLVLSNGQIFEGELIGSPLNSSGELVFTTGMVGYCEALTDPSYFGQILVFTYPLIGNYGIPEVPTQLSLPIPKGFESNKVHASGAVLTVDSAEAFHWRSFESLDAWLEHQGVPGIIGIDTRHLVHIIRDHPNIKARIEPASAIGFKQLINDQSSDDADSFFDPSAQNILPYVSNPQPKLLGESGPIIGLIDCGVKWNIIRQLINQNVRVQLIPWDDELEKYPCDGWLISNGPGDPSKAEVLIQRVMKLIEADQVILGICLGHQIVALAAGMKTERMGYGHRSHNQPVYLVGTRRGFVSSQNHGYVVSEESLPSGWEVWFRNANDQSIEGLCHQTKLVKSVQFHPEAAGGPRETAFIIKEFVEEVMQRCR